MQAYSDPDRESDPYALPDLEVFYVDKNEHAETCPVCNQTDPPHESEHVGWYYWHCFPGYMPDSEPIGPFDTETEALEDARNA